MLCMLFTYLHIRLAMKPWNRWFTETLVQTWKTANYVNWTIFFLREILIKCSHKLMSWCDVCFWSTSRTERLGRPGQCANAKRVELGNCELIPTRCSIGLRVGHNLVTRLLATASKLQEEPVTKIDWRRVSPPNWLKVGLDAAKWQI